MTNASSCICLQVIHITLLSKLEVRNTHLKHAHSVRKLQEEVLHLFYSIKQTVESSHVLDSSGQYKIVSHILGATHTNPHNKDTLPDVTLVSQCSLNHIHHIAHLSKRWPGPVSVAVFTNVDNVPFTIELILQLYYCVPSMRHNVTMHLVLQFTSMDIVLPPKPSAESIFVCGNLAEKVHLQQQAHNYALEGVKYTTNLLRNVALTSSHTEYVFVVDIDMLPNADLYRDFTNYLQIQLQEIGDDSKTFVYVVPVFEIQPHIQLPQNKEQLLLLWKQNKLRPFYYELCWACQRLTNYKAWRRLLLREGVGMGMGYEVAWVDPWEPFFIAPRSAPLYDERFKQYGFNRISQVGC